MTTLDRNPYEGYAPRLMAEYGRESEIGRLVQRGDARKRLEEMEAAEDVIRRQKLLNAEISDRFAQMAAEQRLSLDYLLQFGVVASERETFHQILVQVAEEGGMGLREVAELATARSTIQRNGSCVSEGGEPSDTSSGGSSGSDVGGG